MLVIDRPALAQRYAEVRAFTEALSRPLTAEDCAIQSMPDCSPTKWHLAHTTWFFETFVLRPNVASYVSPDDRYNYLFNSYYEAVGERHPRPQRGLLSRPSLDEVYRYRAYVDERMAGLLRDERESERLSAIVTLGVHHEQQHQELLLTDVKHVFSCNPLRPSYSPAAGLRAGPGTLGLNWRSYGAGLAWVGHEGFDFAFDNEEPRHQEFVQPFGLASRLVTNGEYLAFIEDGGYSRPELWLSAGWATVQERGWGAPLYWERSDGSWSLFTLSGMRALDPHEPVCHVSYFEADAYARWWGARLPSEAEWELAAGEVPTRGNFVESGRYHPAPPRGETSPDQLFGDVWEWTRSAYSPYPGFRTAPGAVGEYNGKFMCNQYVLRGGSCATSETHIRATYRNFFPTDARWQFSGIRLARDE